MSTGSSAILEHTILPYVEDLSDSFILITEPGLVATPSSPPNNDKIQKQISLQDQSDITILPIESRYIVGEDSSLQANPKFTLINQPSELKSLPYSAIVQLQINLGGQNIDYFASGVLIGPRHVLTAAQNIFDKDHKCWATNVKVLVARCQGTSICKVCLASRLYVFPRDSSRPNLGYDLGLVLLDESIGYSCGWLSLACCKDDMLDNANIDVIGYSYDKESQNIIRKCETHISNVRQDTIEYEVGQLRASMGTCLLWKKDSESMVVGIQGIEGNQAKGFRVSKVNFEAIVHILSKTYECLNGGAFELTEATIKSPTKKIIKAEPEIEETKKDDFPVEEEIFIVRSEEDVAALQAKSKRSKVTEVEISCLDLGSKWEELCLAVESLNYLEFLDIDLKNCNHLEPSNIEALFAHLEKKTSLMRLLIDCSKCSQISDKAIISLASLFSELKALVELELIFTGCSHIQESTFKCLMSGLEVLENLTEIRINFEGCKNLTDACIVAGARSIEKAKFLRHVQFCFDGKTVSDTSMIILSLSLKNKKSLKVLSLAYTNSSLSDNGQKVLTDSLKTLGKTLATLDLNFSGSENIGDGSLEALALALQELSSLLRLKISFKGCKKITDKGVSVLSSSIQTLTELKSLHINLMGCLKISDVGVKNVFEALQKLGSLAELHLNLNTIKGVTESGIKLLTNCIKTNKGLTNFGLFVGKCKSLNENGLKALIGTLGNLSTLNSLSLDLSDNDFVTDAIIEGLSKILKGLSSLSALHLDFNTCLSLTDSSVKSLSTALLSSTMLKKMYLSLRKCPKIKGTGIKSMVHYLRQVIALDVDI